MGIQQSKVSKTRARLRNATKHYRGLQTTACKHCGAPRLSHRVCPACGYYGSRQVLTVAVKGS